MVLVAVVVVVEELVVDCPPEESEDEADGVVESVDEPEDGGDSEDVVEDELCGPCGDED